MSMKMSYPIIKYGNLVNRDKIQFLLYIFILFKKIHNKNIKPDYRMVDLINLLLIRDKEIEYLFFLLLSI